MRVHTFMLASGELCGVLVMTLSSCPIPGLRQLSIPEEPDDGLSPRRRKFIGLEWFDTLPMVHMLHMLQIQIIPVSASLRCLAEVRGLKMLKLWRWYVIVKTVS